MAFCAIKGEDKMSHYFTNEEVKSELRKINVNIKDRKFIFNVDNGVFSKRGLDFGSRTLIETLLSEKLVGNGLDVGCGYGPIGIILSSFFNLKIDMIDINKRAVHLCEMNIKENKVSCTAFVSDIYDAVSKKYDFIVTNPPIRAGKDVVYNILFKSKDYLLPGGVLYFVVNKNQGAKSIVRDMEKVSKVSILNKYKGFFIIKCIF
jgi:16S rRNA (guanine1207-N2)-methyltransferase